MPPRKKAADADGAAPAPTRSSTRTKTAPAAAAPAATTSKPKSKRARAASDDEDDDDAPAAKKPASKKAAAAKKPASKKAKTAAAAKDDDDDDADVDPPAKMVTVLKRGKAPVDSCSGKVNTHQVYSNDEGVWDAMLNQTNIDGSNNNNKFYVLQLLHPIGNDAQCILYTRWGRVGADGQTQVKGPWPAGAAINEFKKQFKAKAAVNWEDRVGMVAKSGKYTWLERDYGDEEEEETSGKGDKKKDKGPIPDSALQPELQEFCNLLFFRLRMPLRPYS
ncbi:Poly [ADP-ribose] polymerase [Mycena venus]|uniref:NAD(+) ADP-ribosyltransferase n=1 Tax=Mycena venus TaxID=2733690 RepID=A0A8H6XGU5_9AGAR|nr:Poly [ADP-ribose] polymerase [Mycena venus]